MTGDERKVRNRKRYLVLRTSGDMDPGAAAAALAGMGRMDTGEPLLYPMEARGGMVVARVQPGHIEAARRAIDGNDNFQRMMKRDGRPMESGSPSAARRFMALELDPGRRRYKPTRRTYRKRYIVLELLEHMDRRELARALNSLSRGHRCQVERERPWMYLLDIRGRFAVVRVPLPCLGAARELLSGGGPWRTLRTAGTARKARSVFGARRRRPQSL